MMHRRPVAIGILAVWLLLMPAAIVAQTPGASPAVTIGGWRVSDVQEVATEGRSEVLSPDGKWLVGLLGGDELCVWEVASLAATCLAEPLPNDIATAFHGPSFAWSPDSTAVAFASVTIGMSPLDSDILVFEVATRRLTNLTDDGYDGSIFDFPIGVPLDDSPSWSPDGRQIAFSRLILGPDGFSLSIMRVDRSGGEPVELLPLGQSCPTVGFLTLAVLGPMAWLPDDTLLYTLYDILELDHPASGLWRGIPNGNAKMLVDGVQAADVPGPIIHDVHQDSGLVSLYSIYRHDEWPETVPPGEVYWLLDLVDGSLTPLPEIQIDGQVAEPASPAVFSPDGSVALTVYAAGGEMHLVLLDPAMGAHQVLDHPELEPEWVYAGWAENDTVLVYGAERMTVVHLERELAANSP